VLTASFGQERWRAGLTPFKKGEIHEKSSFCKGGPACHCKASLPAKPARYSPEVANGQGEAAWGTSGQV